jgi:DNA-binding NarL/FixJ family response regulator
MELTIAIVEDDPGLRSGLAALIDSTPGFVLHGVYASAEEALAGIPKTLPKVTLMDINLPRLSGIEAVRKLKCDHPQLVIVMLTICDSPEEVFPALAAGANGYLLKRTPPAKLLEAIEEVYRHGSVLSPPIARMVVDSFYRQPKPAEKPLTQREESVLRALVKGLRYKEIAVEFNVSVETIHTHVRHIYEKLHVTSRTEAAMKYLGRSHTGQLPVGTK